jgi:hypothetical protein
LRNVFAAKAEILTALLARHHAELPRHANRLGKMQISYKLG